MKVTPLLCVLATCMACILYATVDAAPTDPIAKMPAAVEQIDDQVEQMTAGAEGGGEEAYEGDIVRLFFF